MAKQKGWIKLYRQIANSYIWLSSDPFDRRSAWIDLLLLANHEERTVPLRNGNNQIVGEGQVFRSLDHLATRWHWSRNKVRRFLTQLSTQEMCTIKGTKSGTLITIVKYGDFQHGRYTNGQANEQTDEQTNGQTDGQRTRTNKQELSNKNVKQDGANAPQDSSGRYELE